MKKRICGFRKWMAVMLCLSIVMTMGTGLPVLAETEANELGQDKETVSGSDGESVEAVGGVVSIPGWSVKVYNGFDSCADLTSEDSDIASYSDGTLTIKANWMVGITPTGSNNVLKVKAADGISYYVRGTAQKEVYYKDSTPITVRGNYDEIFTYKKDGNNMHDYRRVYSQKVIPYYDDIVYGVAEEPGFDMGGELYSGCCTGDAEMYPVTKFGALNNNDLHNLTFTTSEENSVMHGSTHLTADFSTEKGAYDLSDLTLEKKDETRNIGGKDYDGQVRKTIPFLQTADDEDEPGNNSTLALLTMEGGSYKYLYMPPMANTPWSYSGDGEACHHLEKDPSDPKKITITNSQNDQIYGISGEMLDYDDFTFLRLTGVTADSKMEYSANGSSPHITMDNPVQGKKYYLYEKRRVAGLFDSEWEAADFEDSYPFSGKTYAMYYRDAPGTDLVRMEKTKAVNPASGEEEFCIRISPAKEYSSAKSSPYFGLRVFVINTNESSSRKEHIEKLPVEGECCDPEICYAVRTGEGNGEILYNNVFYDSYDNKLMNDQTYNVYAAYFMPDEAVSSVLEDEHADYFSTNSSSGSGDTFFFDSKTVKLGTIGPQSGVPLPDSLTVEDLTYNGSVQTITVKNGEDIFSTDNYDLTIKQNDKPAVPRDAGDYTAVITGKGKYTGTVEKTFTIKKADYTKTDATGQARFGTTGMTDLTEYIAEGGKIGVLSITDPHHVISDNKISISGSILSFTFLDDESNSGKTAQVKIPVTDAKNYKDYTISVALTVNTCNHSATELRNVRAGNCTEKGYSGDVYCKICGAFLSGGHDTAIDPDNHDFILTKSEITRPATILRKGETTYTYQCTRCKKEKVESKDDIPYEESEDQDYSDLREDLDGLSGNNLPDIKNDKDDKGNDVETVTIGGEEVLKTITDPDGKEIVQSKVWIGGLQSSYTYTGSAIKPVFHVYDGTRKLTEKTDYKATYSKNKNVGTAKIKLEFKGNYKDTKPEELFFEIKPAVLGVDVIAHEKGVEAKKKEQKPVPVLTWASTGKTVDSRNFNVAYEPSPVKEAGAYTATITPKKTGGNFAKSTTAKITVTEKSKILSYAKVKFNQKSYAYTGQPIVPGYTLKIGDVELKEDVDYRRVSLTGNIGPGKAVVIFEAISGNSTGYTGTQTASFQIAGKVGLKEDAPFEYSYKDSVPFAKGGAEPAVTVKYDGTLLKEGTDYTVSYEKNKTVTSGATAELQVKGKGKYSGTVTKRFAITKQSLKASGITVTVADQFTTKSKLKKPQITIRDLNGKKLKAGTDYAAGEPDTSKTGNTEEYGEATVVITGKGNYSDEQLSASFRYMETVSSNLAKSKTMKSISPRDYTGRVVKLSNSDLTEILYTGSKDSPNYLMPGRDFLIKGYSDNVKNGTAKVTLQGLGDYAGTKTLTFKIVQRKVDFKGSLIGGEWK